VLKELCFTETTRIVVAQNLPALQELGYLCPLVSEPLMCLENNLFFARRDRVLVDLRIQVVMPPIVKMG
jgi:hypothetical protein